jgi:hypothetical protein
LPGVTPQPYDPALAEQQLVGGRNIALANGESAYQTGNLGFDYGYNPDGTVNTANPYSRAALYQLAYTNSKRATTNGMAAQGQLYSGAYGHQQGLNDEAYARNEAGNRLAYQRAIHGVQSGKLATYANAGTGVGDADFSALLRATYPGRLNRHGQVQGAEREAALTAQNKNHTHSVQATHETERRGPRRRSGAATDLTAPRLRACRRYREANSAAATAQYGPQVAVPRSRQQTNIRPVVPGLPWRGWRGTRRPRIRRRPQPILRAGAGLPDGSGCSDRPGS